MNDPKLSLSPSELQRREEYAAKCVSCGACCCFYAREPAMIGADGPAAEDPALSYFVQITHTNRWPDGDLEVLEETQRVMYTKDLQGFPACVALEGRPGQDVGCSIYETRPEHCRGFQPGSDMCLQTRQWAGFESAP